MTPIDRVAYIILFTTAMACLIYTITSDDSIAGALGSILAVIFIAFNWATDEKKNH